MWYDVQKVSRQMGSPIMHFLHNAPLLHPNFGNFGVEFGYSPKAKIWHSLII